MKFEGNYLENKINFDPIKSLDKLIKETKSSDLVIHFLRVHVSEGKCSLRLLVCWVVTNLSFFFFFLVLESLPQQFVVSRLGFPLPYTVHGINSLYVYFA